jgi:hypothetical protein
LPFTFLLYKLPAKPHLQLDAAIAARAASAAESEAASR